MIDRTWKGKRVPCKARTTAKQRQQLQPPIITVAAAWSTCRQTTPLNSPSTTPPQNNVVHPFPNHSISPSTPTPPPSARPLPKSPSSPTPKNTPHYSDRNSSNASMPYDVNEE
eukprot:scaffold383_cov310-Alexandrium_tamarense.AAC.4